MFCTNCGKQMPDGSAFCTSCGNKMAEIPDQETTPSMVENVPNEEVVEVAANEDLVEVTKVEEIIDQPKENQGEETPSAPVESPSTNITPSDIKSEVVASTPINTSVAPQTPAAVSTPIIAPVAPKTPATASTSVNQPPKKSSSTGIVLVVGLIAVIALLFLLFGKGSGYKDYKSLVKDYYNAIYKEDFNALVKLYDKDTQKDMKEDKDEIKDAIEDAKDLLEESYDKGWQKKVKPIKSTRLDKDDGVTYYSVSVDIDEGNDAVGIKKIKDKYYIDEERDHIAD